MFTTTVGATSADADRNRSWVQSFADLKGALGAGDSRVEVTVVYYAVYHEIYRMGTELFLLRQRLYTELRASYM